MYSVNGVPLANPTFGWVFRAPSKPLSDHAHDLQSLTVQGRDGVIAGLPGVTRPVVLPLMVQTPREHLETLVALFGKVGVLSKTADATREVQFEIASHSLAGHGPAESIVDATFLLRLPGAFWRASAVDGFGVVLSAASESLSVFPGLSAPVQDAMVRLQGQASGVQVLDSSGAWVTLPDAAAGQWVRFESATGRCFRTTTDTWTGGTDVSGLVDFGGPRNVFEITPKVNLGDLSRAGQLTVTSGTRSGAVVAVRGKSAHAV